MKEESNLLCPYKVEKLPNSFIYKFTTKNNIDYEVVFVESTYTTNSTNGTYAPKIYDLTIDKLSDTPPPLDARVQLTIDFILKDFLKDVENVFTYTCESLDKKEKARLAKFNRWYDLSELKDDVIKSDNIFTITINDEELEQYVSTVYHKEHPFADSIEEIKEEIVGELSNVEK